MNLKPFQSILAFGACAALMAPAATADIIIADSVADLTRTDSGGASSSVSSDTLTIATSKNSSVEGDFGTTVELANNGDYLTVSYTVQFDNVPVNTSSSFGIGFLSSSNSHFFEVAFNPVSTSNTVVFRELGDTNLNKYDGNLASTDTQTISFTLTRNGADMDLTVDSSLIAVSPRTVQNDVLPLGASSFDRINFSFNGNAYNEDFGGNPITATVTDFSITTNVVPEPGSMLLIGGGVLMLCRRWQDR